MPDTRPEAKHTSEPSRIERGMTWLGKMRLRAAVAVIGIPLVCFSVLSMSAWITIPLVSVAVAVTVSTFGARFETSTCWTCGTDLANEDAGVHGVICPKCGALNQHNPGLLTSRKRA
ncbi:MAG: hypothetical protein AAGH64_00030 [Planctomycetota bacterium]